MKKEIKLITDISGFEPIYLDGKESNYRINSEGTLISFYFKKWIYTNPSINRGGYLQTSLHVGKKKFNCLIHRLVAICFIPNPNGYSQINHKDCNKTNNHISNLEWCNGSMNTKHAYENGLIDLRKRTGLFRPKPIGKYFAGILLKRYDSITSVEKDGYPSTSVYRSASDGRTCKGFNWKFID